MAGRRSDRLPRLPFPVDAPLYVVSVAAELAGMHPQTLRQYDRLGLVSPGRAGGGGRRYSLRNIARLREVHRLSQDDGVNLAGIKRILELEDQLQVLQDQLDALEARIAESTAPVPAGESGGPADRRTYLPTVVDAHGLVVWRPQRRR